MGYKMNGWSGYQTSPLTKKIKQDKSKDVDKIADKDKKHKVGDHTTYKHPTYYNHDGSINKGGSTGDFDEGELSKVMKNQDGKRYVERSDGKILFLDRP